MKKIIKAIIITIASLFLFTFIVPMRIAIFNIGNLSGCALCICIILVTVYFEKIIALCKKKCKSKRGKAIISTVCVILTVGIICFSATLGSIIYESKGDADNQQTLIVLGCAVKGNTPSVTLRKRVNSAYEYLEKNPESVAVLSGGQGNNENISEAECMYNMLTEKGIDASRLYMENQSVSTETNIRYSKKIIEKYGLGNDIAVVSSDYHLKRAKMICKKQGLDVKTISASSTLFDKSTFYLREVFGVVKEFVF